MGSIIIKRILYGALVSKGKEYGLYLVPEDSKSSLVSFVLIEYVFSLEEANKRAKEIKESLDSNWEVRIVEVERLLKRII